MVGMTSEPKPQTEPRVQLHIWVDQDVAEWVRHRAYTLRKSRGKTVEAIIRTAMANELE